METIMPMTEFRADMYGVVRKVRKDRRHVILTKNGRPEAVVMSPEELETLEILADRNLMRQVARAEKDLVEKAAGRFVRHEDIFRV
ncbi:MAG: type II toxin-antitoxin system Phd/YefM family antitoxin [Planctomycetota bacterium]